MKQCKTLKEFLNFAHKKRKHGRNELNCPLVNEEPVTEGEKAKTEVSQPKRKGKGK